MFRMINSTNSFILRNTSRKILNSGRSKFNRRNKKLFTVLSNANRSTHIPKSILGTYITSRRLYFLQVIQGSLQQVGIAQ